MKKALSLILSLTLLWSLTGCGGSSEGGASSAPAASAGAESGAAETEAPAAETMVFDGQTVVDNEACAIVVTGIDPDGFWGYTLSVELENRSAETTYMFSLSDAAVDGLQCSAFFAAEVAAGKKSVDSIYFSDDELEENGIGFTDLELTFRVYDSGDWMADEVALETVHIYPYGEDKAETFERTPRDTDNVIVDNEYVTVTVLGYEEDPIWGYTVELFLENKTETEVMFSVDEASVNGYMADPFWAKSVLPGKCAFSSMSWYDTTLESSGVTGDIEEIEFVLTAYDYENWLADKFVRQTVVLNP